MANLPRSMTLQTHPSLQPATQAGHHPITMARQWNTSLVPGPVTIPFLYRLTITTIEPLFAITGVVQAVRYPSDYMSVMTRGAVASTPERQFLHTQLAGAWVFFAFVEAVVLRVVHDDDERLWRFLTGGMLLSDLAWCHSAAQAVGGWTTWANWAAWTAQDHWMFWTSAPIAVMRICIVLRIGLKEDRASNQISMPD